MKIEYRYEGCYTTDNGMNLCLRLVTNGVPQFTNIFIRPGDLRPDEIKDFSRLAALALKAQEGPPWQDEANPGIG